MKITAKPRHFFKTLLLSMLLICSGVFSSRASHYAAVDMYVDFIGSSATDYTYNVTLVIFKACDVAGSPDLPTTTNVYYYTPSGCSGCGTLTLTAPIIDTVDNLCDTFKPHNSCHDLANFGIGLYGFVRHTFTKTITLPKACTDWTFSWTDGARNAAIKNLVCCDNIYVDCGINNIHTAAVNSPRFLVDPIPYVCVNNPAVINNGPYDPDLDSIVTVNTAPRGSGPNCPSYTAGYTNVTNSPGYSLTYPIDVLASDPYAVDPNTGTSTFTPTVTGKYVLAYRLFKYDHNTGELLGFTTRDVQINVIGCVAPPPVTDSFPTSVSGAYYDSLGSILVACPGTPFHFDIGATTFSSKGHIFSNWDLSLLSGATYSTTGEGSSRVVGTLYWTPTKADVGYRTIKLKFKDSSCAAGQPIILTKYYILRIRVLPAVDAGKDGVYCPPSGAGWKMRTVTDPTSTYKWISIAGSPTTPPPYMDYDTLGNATVKPAVNSTYVVTGTSLYGPYRCATKDTVNVVIKKPLITVNAGPDQTVCANKLTVLNGSVTPTSSVALIKWTPNSSLNDSTIATPTAKPYATTNYVLYAEDVNGCGYADTTKLIVDGIQPNIAPFASRDTVCPKGFAQLYSNISLQSCGLAQNSCVGGIPVDKILGTDVIPSTDPSPFFMFTNSGGERMQIIYRRDELKALGIEAGFINSMSFNLPAKNTTDSFYKFSIKMACTTDDYLSGSTMSSYPGTSEVFNSKAVGTIKGWNEFDFPVPYYWDGNNSIVVELCWSKVYGTYGGSADPVYSSNTTYTSVKYIGSYALASPSMGDGCSLSSTVPLLASSRPNTKFNVCIAPAIFKYAWTPTTYLTHPDSANTNVVDIDADENYAIKVTSLSNPSCFSTGVVPLRVDRTNSVTALLASPYIVCRPGYVTLDAQGNGPKPLRNLPCSASNPPIVCNTPTNIIVANPSINGSLGGETINQPFNGTYTTAHTQYIIPKAALVNGKMSSGTIKGLSLDIVGGVATSFNNLKISLMCVDLTQFPSTAPISLETGAILVYSRASEIFSTGSHPFVLDQYYNWDTTKNLLVDICYSGGVAGGSPIVNSYKTPGFNLMAKAYATSGDVCLNPSIETGPYSAQYLPNFTVSFCPAGDTDFSYHWTPGAFVQDTTNKSPIVYVDSTRKVYVSTAGRNGCPVNDSILLFVPEQRRYITHDTFICLHESINLKAFNGTKTVWFEGAGYGKPTTLSCDTCDITIAKPSTTTDYYAAVTDEYGCTDTFKVNLFVKSLPSVSITNNDTTIKYGNSVMLNAFGGTQYNWYPITGLSNPNIVNPIAKPLITTVYTVIGLGMNGCRNTDSVKVTINYRSPLGIPSAFSPNGDGKNDVFKIVGVTFQTLMEFRVYNRWGQEVFNTTDINGGWDGTFKGQPQDMGVYNYIIRVGYPDGYTETYKGDVTIIR
jgi:gliding motility-associated-like protein